MEEKADKFRVCILTAGKGSRLGNRTTYFNKALLKVGDKAVISHTIDAFPKDVEFVIALGYHGDIVKQYLQLAHPDNKFIFVEIDKYSVPGSGPGYALQKCREYLQVPFYFVSCDSIIGWKDQGKELNLGGGDNWAAVAKIKPELKHLYCTVEHDGFNVTKIFDKSPDGTDLAYTGVAFIRNTWCFWNEMDKAQTTVDDEIQVAPSLLLFDHVCPQTTQWWDTGLDEGLEAARQHFGGLDNLDKLDEELYFVDNHVVKYFHNESMVTSRVARAGYLGTTIPKIVGSSKNFYKYEFLNGKDMFRVDNQDELIEPLLKFTKVNLWNNIELNSYEKLIFRDVCSDFYYKKTISRLNKLYDKLNIVDKEELINGDMVPKLEDLFKKIDWDELTEGVPSNFHGDYNLSNILIEERKAFRTFKFLDWRQDFGGLIQYGDRYYDFAKMYHSFLLPHPSVKNHKFAIMERDGLIDTWIDIPSALSTARDKFEKFIKDEGYNFKKVEKLTAIVLLNMSPLHEPPLDRYLFYYGKWLLYKLLNESVS